MRSYHNIIPLKVKNKNNITQPYDQLINLLTNNVNTSFYCDVLTVQRNEKQGLQGQMCNFGGSFMFSPQSFNRLLGQIFVGSIIQKQQLVISSVLPKYVSSTISRHPHHLHSQTRPHTQTRLICVCSRRPLCALKSASIN